MLEPRDRLDLAAEALARSLVEHQLGADDLERDLASERSVLGFACDAHAATTEAAQQPILPKAFRHTQGRDRLAEQSHLPAPIDARTQFRRVLGVLREESRDGGFAPGVPEGKHLGEEILERIGLGAVHVARESTGLVRRTGEQATGQRGHEDCSESGLVRRLRKAAQVADDVARILLLEAEFRHRRASVASARQVTGHQEGPCLVVTERW